MCMWLKMHWVQWCCHHATINLYNDQSPCVVVGDQSPFVAANGAATLICSQVKMTLICHQVFFGALQMSLAAFNFCSMLLLIIISLLCNDAPPVAHCLSLTFFRLSAGCQWQSKNFNSGAMILMMLQVLFPEMSMPVEVTTMAMFSPATQVSTLS